jgi:hypothetical protein
MKFLKQVPPLVLALVPCSWLLGLTFLAAGGWGFIKGRLAAVQAAAFTVDQASHEPRPNAEGYYDLDWLKTYFEGRRSIDAMRFFGHAEGFHLNGQYESFTYPCPVYDAKKKVRYHHVKVTAYRDQVTEIVPLERGPGLFPWLS